jgi:hypothetical protein
MKRKVIPILMMLVLTLGSLFYGCKDESIIDNQSESVVILDRGSYYEVILDFTKNLSHRKIGEEYASKILQVVPDYESIVDSYLLKQIVDKDSYNMYLKRVNDIKLQINPEYKDEIEGMASKFSGLHQNVMGDGKISLDEFYMLNLFPDVIRPTQCAALAVYGKRSDTNNTMAARILDHQPGKERVQAITTFKNGSKSICTIGYLGYIGVITGFNNNKIFTAILDSATEERYSSESKNSYPLDLRYSLENYDSLDKVAEYLKSSERTYAFGHLIFLCDPDISKVLENNISPDANSLSAVRTGESELINGIQWDIDNSIGCVNSFVLNGNIDKHSSNPSNANRWESMKEQLRLKGEKVTLKELKEIASYHDISTDGSQYEGNLYNTMTEQIIIFEPHTLSFQVFFRRKDGKLANVPKYEKVKARF